MNCAFACAVLLVGIAAAPADTTSPGVEWRCSVEEDTWQLLPLRESNSDMAAAASAAVVASAASPAASPAQTALVIDVNTSAVQHEIEGFGGCFNEKGWDALAVLDAEAKTAVMQNLFGRHGLRWALNRMPIGSSDFADSYYSLDDVAGDLSMSKLSLARDEEKLIPFIKAAMEVNPELTLWGVPWTGPSWLKDSDVYDCGSLSSDPKKRTAYALYLAKAAKLYRAAGLNFKHLFIQNEPSHGGIWNGSACPKKTYSHMAWTGKQLADFLKTELGPAFEAEGIADDVDIFLATISPPKGDAVDYTNLLAPALSDPGVVKYLSGIGLQYAGIGLFDAIKKANPTLKTWETETPCGNGRARDCGTGPGTRNNSWAWGESQWSTMRSFLEAGASVYSQWNMVLDQTGMSGWGWSQCSPVTIDNSTKKVTYEGSYWATKHYSYYVDAGATMVSTAGDVGKCTAVNGACGCKTTSGCTGRLGYDTEQFISFVNPDHSIVVVGLNAGNGPHAFTLKVDGKVRVANATLPPHSFNTFKLPSSQLQL